MDTRGKSTGIILIVDDMPENIAVLDRILGDTYKIKIAKEGKMALKVASTQPLPDLILLDIVLPGMNGYQVCRALKESEVTRDIPVIFVTSKDDTGDELEGFEAGAVDYITKPVSPPVVRARVKTQLALKEALRNLKQQNSKLTEAARLREDVERIGRHDLKSPLSGVLTYSQMLLDLETEEKKVKYLKKIESSGLRMLNMINRSLDLFKMEQGLYRLKPGKINLVPLIFSVIEENRSLLSGKDIRLECLLDKEPLLVGSTCFICGEELLCYSMLSNLLTNALEASPVEEMVYIELEMVTQGDVIIKMSNKGEIPLEIREKFFDKYTTAGKKKGTGLGTYSASLIARIHGGSISFTTDTKEGTVITVILPGAKEE